MIDDADFTGLVAAVYDAAMDRNLWTSVLERIADAVQAGGSALIMQDRRSGLGEGIFVRGDPASFGVYFEHFAAINPLIPASEHLQSGAVTVDRDVVDRSVFVRSEYYRGFMLPNDMSSMLSLTVLKQGDQHCAFNFCRRPGQEEHGAEELAVGRALMPHLQRAFAITTRLAEAESRLGASDSALDRLACGVLVFDAQASLIHANVAAQRTAAAQDGLGFGRAGTTSAGGKLQAAIERAAREGQGASLLLPRPSGARPISALVIPLRHESIWLSRQPAVLVVLGDPDAPDEGVEQRLVALHGLTGAEAKVARQLMTGAGPDEIARQLGIGIATVRQHISRTLSKTGTSRQPDLVQLLMRTVGLVI